MEFFLKKDILRKIVINHVFRQLLGDIIVLVFLYFGLGIIMDMVELFGFTVGFILLYEIIKQLITIHKIRKEWLTYKITLQNDRIYKTQYKKKEITIMRDEISGVTEMSNSGMWIQTEQQMIYLFIPKSLDKYDIFRNEIAKWCVIAESPVSTLKCDDVLQFSLASRDKRNFSRMIFNKKNLFWGGIIVCFLILVITRFLAM